MIKKMLFKKKNTLNEEVFKSNTIHYERLNFFNHFRNNGYVKKVLCLYGDIGSHSDVVYFNDRSRTEVPCIDNEIFIISNYDHEKNIDTYTLVQIDFSIPIKFKILMIQNSEDCHTNPKYEIYKYIRENKLVKIKDKPEMKRPQIDFGYGSIILEVLEILKISSEENKNYTKKEFYDLILENVKFSESYKKSADSIQNEKTMYLRVKNRVMDYLNIIFDGYHKDSITIYQAFDIGKRYQENYYYNI